MSDAVPALRFQGAHVILFSADADRRFCRDVLGFPAVDAGRGWLIFGLPPAELAFHPAATAAAASSSAQEEAAASFYLMCADLDAAIVALQERGVACGPVHQERWGRVTHLPLPSGARLGLYQPLHPTALGLQAP